MTLDIPKFIENSVRTQSKIHHLDINVKAVKKDEIPDSVTSLIYKDYGEKYLDDADYVTFFWGGIDKDNIDKLFNTVDKALGKSANKLTDKDFKKIHMDGSSEEKSDEEDNEDTKDEETNDEDQEIDIEASEEISDVNDEEQPEEGQEDEEDKDEEDEDKEDADDKSSDEDDEDEDALNEDDEEKLEIDIKEEKPIPTAYFFLKITTK